MEGTRKSDKEFDSFFRNHKYSREEQARIRVAVQHVWYGTLLRCQKCDRPNAFSIISGPKSRLVARCKSEKNGTSHPPCNAKASARWLHYTCLRDAQADPLEDEEFEEFADLPNASEQHFEEAAQAIPASQDTVGKVFQPYSPAPAPNPLETLVSQLRQENSGLRAQLASLQASFVSLESTLNQLLAQQREAASVNLCPSSPAPVTGDGLAPEPMDTEDHSSAPPCVLPAPLPPSGRPSSWADAARLGQAIRSTNSDALARARRAAHLLTTRRRKPAPADKLVLLYVGGIQRMAISKVKALLRDLRFDVRPSAIANISFLGGSTCEFLLHTDYVAHFRRQAAALALPNFRILDNFRACQAADPEASASCRDRLRTNLQHRVWAIIEREGCLPAVREFFSAYLSSLNFPTSRPQAESAPMNPDEVPLPATPSQAPTPTAVPLEPAAPPAEPMNP